MDENAITHYITDTFDGVDIVENSGDTFFFGNPDQEPAPDHMFPFATIVTSDNYDDGSNLNRPSVFRLNFGVGKQTFRELFGTGDADANSYDFTALDQLMPHPTYGKMFWVCVLNPTEATFQSVQPLLAESYSLAANRDRRRRKKSE